ncbi:hypothetical protein ACHAXA_010082 [Cyclostephanos tholiformis]|uniref:RING-type domain-containing protein n=1 Tax=Cyclostephanos tholiformis TaxID=382380 RepID=A0ABD3R8I4_9STRA
MPDASFWFVWIFLTVCLVFLCLSDFTLRYRRSCRRHTNDDNEEEICYDVLPMERRLELDELRSTAILRRLSRFTLVLKVGNMLKKLGDTEPSPSMDDDIAVWDEEGQSKASDVETVVVTPDNLVHSKSSYFIDEDDSEYTHLLIPRPGRTTPDIIGQGLDDSCNRKTKRITLFSLKPIRTTKVGQDVTNRKMEKAEADIVKDLVTETRPVPIYCAVCLTRYEVSNRVCWSSNSECSHVFHEDCMLHWLVVLGRKRSVGKRFSKNPSERKLLEFDLTCPCCRQDFISRDVVLGTDENV